MTSLALAPDTRAVDPVDPKVFRAAMGQFATGVTVVTFWVDGQPGGLTANAFMSVSMDPPLVLVSIRSASRFVREVHVDGYYGVSVLSEQQQALSGHFGGRSIVGIESPFTEYAEFPLIRDALVQITAKVVAIHPAGDHLLYLGRIESLRVGEPRKPLVFFSGKYKQFQAQEPPTVSWHSVDGW